MEELDLAIVGAGCFGLVVAKTFLQIHPDMKLAVIESASTLGGTWSKDRLYPGLITQNMRDTYQYPDFPLDPKYGVKSDQHIPGRVVYEYLTDYAKHFGVFSRIQLNTKVETIEKTDGKWILSVHGPDGPKTILARKLVLATGLTNEPFIPNIPGREDLEVPFFHSKDFLKHADTIQTAKNAVVLGGGNKSAFDVAYQYAMSGCHVDLIIRESGHGPVWMVPPRVTPLKVRLEKLVTIRALTWFSPCIWGNSDGHSAIRWFLRKTAVGRFLVNSFWTILGTDGRMMSGIDKHPETKKLRPWGSISDVIYVGCNLSLLNYPTDFLELVRNGTVTVHIADITHCSPKTVHLSNGTEINADVVVACSGWKKRPSIKFLPEGIESKLGLPMPLETDKLVMKAEQEILTEFPRFQTQPSRDIERSRASGDEAKITYGPYRLFRFMVPADLIFERNFAMAGMLLTFSTPILASVQALWMAAYFDGVWPIKSSLPETSGDIKTDIEWETMLQSQFGKLRYPCGYGPKHPDVVFDSLPYVDMMLKEIGLKTRRKPTIWTELFTPYSPLDYKTIVEEDIAKRAQGTNGSAK